jgi:glucuronoarabinoxylan endo-1,4-beta-xylanase
VRANICNNLYIPLPRWWVDSLRAYARIGIMPRYISMQNEPDYSAPHQACLFGARESFSVPGYFRAATELYGALKNAFANPPLMIGPESFGMEGYLEDFPYAGGGLYAAVSNHLYASGSKDDPYSFNAALLRTAAVARAKQIPEVWMSEYAFLGAHRYQDPLRLGILIHNTLTLADCTTYLHWDGLWAYAADNDEGTMILVEDPAKRNQWKNAKGFEIKHSFWWLMHFSRSIRAGYRRVQVDIVIRDVLASAWTGPSGQFSLILINTGVGQAFVTIADLPAWVETQVTDIFYSTLDVGYTYAGRLNGNFVSLLPLSIYTIFSYKPN